MTYREKVQTKLNHNLEIPDRDMEFMQKDISGSILLGSGAIASVLSKVSSTEYYLSTVDKALIIGVIILGIALLGAELKEEYL